MPTPNPYEWLTWYDNSRAIPKISMLADKIESAATIIRSLLPVPVRERLPTEEDADENGTILIWRKYGDCFFASATKWQQICDRSTHWARIPPLPTPAHGKDGQ